MNNDLKDILDNKELEKFPFKVPENYFDTLTERIMSNIPEEVAKETGKRRNIFTLRPLRWAASIACVMVISATSMFYVTKHNSNSIAINTSDTVGMKSHTAQDDIMTEAAEYTMLDNQDIYMLLAEE